MVSKTLKKVSPRQTAAGPNHQWELDAVKDARLDAKGRVLLKVGFKNFDASHDEWVELRHARLRSSSPLVVQYRKAHGESLPFDPFDDPSELRQYAKFLRIHFPQPVLTRKVALGMATEARILPSLSPALLIPTQAYSARRSCRSHKRLIAAYYGRLRPNQAECRHARCQCMFRRLSNMRRLCLILVVARRACIARAQPAASCTRAANVTNSLPVPDARLKDHLCARGATASMLTRQSLRTHAARLIRSVSG